MLTLTNIKYILFAFIVLGIFANFAQEEYGADVVNWCTLLLAFTFLGNVAQLGLELWKNKIVSRMLRGTVIYLAVSILWFYYTGNDIWGISLLIFFPLLVFELFFIAIANRKNHPNGVRWTFISFGLFLLFISLYFKIMHWPGANAILMVGGLTSLIPFMIMSIKTFSSEYKNGKGISLVYLCLLLNILVGIVAMVFKNLHWPFAILVFVFETFLLLLFLLPLALNMKFRYGTEKISVARFLKAKNPSLTFLFVYFSFGALIMTMFFFDVGPKYYSLARPPVLEKMIDESPGGNGTAQSKKYQENYYDFMDHWANEDNN